MKRITILALMILAIMPATAYATDYSSEAAWEAECSGTLNAFQDQQVHQVDLKTQGRVDYNGHEFTWYSEKALPGEGLTELNANGRTVDDNGYVVDGDGYIAIASPWGIDPIGTIVETPFGMAKVYDVCEDDSYDVYTSW